MVAADARAVSATEAAPRLRLLRDSGAVLFMGLSALGLVAIAVMPVGGPYGPSRTFLFSLSVTRRQATRNARPTAGPSLALVKSPGSTAKHAATPRPTAAPRATPTGAVLARDASDAKAEPQGHVAADAEPDANSQTPKIDAKADPSVDADRGCSGGEDHRHRGPFLR